MTHICALHLFPIGWYWSRRYKQLEQGSADYGPWAKSGLPPVFVNKVLLEHSQIHSLTYFQWLFPTYDRNYMAHMPKIFTLGPFQEKFADLCSRRLILYFIHHCISNHCTIPGTQ